MPYLVTLVHGSYIKKSSTKIFIQTLFQSMQTGDRCCIIPLNSLTPNATLLQLFLHNQLILLQRLLEYCRFKINPDQKEGVNIFSSYWFCLRNLFTLSHSIKPLFTLRHGILYYSSASINLHISASAKLRAYLA